MKIDGSTFNFQTIFDSGQPAGETDKSKHCRHKKYTLEKNNALVDLADAGSTC